MPSAVVPLQEQLLDRIKRIVNILRKSPRERVLALIAAAALSAGLLANTLDIRPAAEWIRLGGFTLGAGFAVWLFVRVWRQLRPPDLVGPEIRPRAIKGLFPFGVQDGELFQALGRRSEVSELLGHVLDDQVSLVVLMGDSGAGKTSLLRAGLTPVLTQQQIPTLYWEAVPTTPADALLHAVQAQWPAGVPQGVPTAAVPVKLADLIDPPDSLRRVVILDQFEQLDPQHPAHAEVFGWLRQVAGHAPPVLTTVIIAFRRDFDPGWREFELESPTIRPRMLSLKLFSEERAKNVMAAVAEAAGFRPDQALVLDLLSASSKSGRVSPVDIGIAMLVLNEAAAMKGRAPLRLPDYRFAGGSEGLLTGYLQERVARFIGHDQAGVMRALLGLVDLETDQRVAEGRSLSALAGRRGVRAERLERHLDYLASPQVRLLEAQRKQGGVKVYRLAHERLIPSLRQLMGVLLAESARARLTLESGYRIWQRVGGRKYLLAGSDLRLVLRHRNEIVRGSDHEQKARYVRRSVRYRSRKRGLGGLVTLCALLLFVGGWGQYELVARKTFLTAWALPSDLLRYQRQARQLSMNKPVTNLRWLDAPLVRLRVTSDALTEISGLRDTLQVLELHGRVISNLAGLEKLLNLTTLDLSETGLTSLAGLENLPNLTTLNLRGTGLTSVAGLENLPNLTTLNLRGTGLTSLAGLEKLPNLTTLDLSGIRLTSLAGLEKLPNLTTLDLSRTGLLTSLAGLEKLPNLTTLDLSGTGVTSLAGLEKLPNLTTLDLSGTGLTSLAGLEKNLTTLNLSGTRLLTSLAGLEKLPNLTALDLSGTRFLTSLGGPEKLPNLRTLNVSETGLTGLAGLENLPNLTALDLSGVRLTSLAGLEKLPNLTTLNLSRTGLTSLAGLERLPNLTTLDLSGMRLTSLAGLEKVPNLATLNLSGTGVTSLAGLEKLPNLTTLDLSGMRLTSLAGLEKLPNLTTLNLGGTGVTSLAGLEKLPNLTTLNLRGTAVTSLAGLEKLPNLTTLNLRGTGVTSLAGLEKLPNLTTLNLRGTGVTSLAELEKVPNLTTLNLRGTGVASLAGLEKLPNLTTLDLSETRLVSLKGLPPSVTELSF